MAREYKNVIQENGFACRMVGETDKTLSFRVLTCNFLFGKRRG